MTTAPVRHLGIEQFFAQYGDREGERWELVAGIPNYLLIPGADPITITGDDLR